MVEAILQDDNFAFKYISRNNLGELRDLYFRNNLTKKESDRKRSLVRRMLRKFNNVAGPLEQDLAIIFNKVAGYGLLEDSPNLINHD